MTLDELKAAVAECRAGVEGWCGKRIDDANGLLAEALLDPSPLSASVLEGLGENKARQPGWYGRYIDENESVWIQWNPCRGVEVFIDDDPKDVFPQPKSVGQLLRLLLTLTENQEGGGG